MLNELVENIPIHKTQHDEKSGAHGAADYSSYGAEAIKAFGYSGSSGCNDDGGDDDDAALSCQSGIPERGLDSAYVECPREKYVPTVTGFWPVARSLRVIRSIACLYISPYAILFRVAESYRYMIGIKGMS